MPRADGVNAAELQLPVWFLVLTAVVCGGFIMVIEVLGSRVIGPFFGVSLFVWTSLIAVALIALSLGYWLGGVLADRYRHPRVLYLLLALAGFLTLLIPWLKAPVLSASMGLGLRGGAFLSTTILFGPSLLALGCVSPFVVRLAVHNMDRLGRTVGRFYALSTLGSVVGTVATGFFLIAVLGIDGILQFIGISLLSLSAGYFIIFDRRPAAIALLLPGLLAAYQSQPGPQRMADGSTVTQIAAEHGYYGSLKVLEYRHGENATRELLIDGLVQGGVDVVDGRSIYEYVYLLGILPTALHPGGRDCLVIGLGAGVTPDWYGDRGVDCDVVDIDPAVVRFAREHFAFRATGEVHIEDARYFLLTHERQYDYLILDVFTGDATPAHLLSQEALQLAASRLRPGGIFAANLVGGLYGDDAYMTASIVRTLATAFETVELVPVFEPSQTEGRGNMIVLAYQGARRAVADVDALLAAVHPLADSLVRASIHRRWRFAAETSAIVLRDDYNPIDFYDAGLRESLRRAILQTTPAALLLDG